MSAMRSSSVARCFRLRFSEKRVTEEEEVEVEIGRKVEVLWKTMQSEKSLIIRTVSLSSCA